MAGAAGLEPVTSAVTGQRSNQLSYAPAQELGKLGEDDFQVNGLFKRFGQRTPRRWGWRTPLKKRTAARIKLGCDPRFAFVYCQWDCIGGKLRWFWHANGPNPLVSNFPDEPDCFANGFVEWILTSIGGTPKIQSE